MKRAICLLLFATLAVSCSRETAAPAGAASPAVNDGSPRDGGTLIRRLEADVNSLNPVLASSLYDRKVDFLLFTPLVHFDEDLRPVPGVADSWTISDDGKVYTFELNPKATFSDGTPVKASDVLFTLKKITDPASEAVQIASGFELLDLEKTRVIDDHTIEIAFREALASQLTRFNDLLPIPEHVYSKGNFRNDHHETAIGAGPYKLARRTPGQEIVLERRADYWAKKPYIQTVIFKIITDNQTAWNALKRGDIDETMLQSDTWQRESKNDTLKRRLEFRRFYTLNYNYVAWNNRNPLFQDKRIRQALTMCLDRKSLINDLYHGTARALNGPFTPDEWSFNPAVRTIEFNPQEAKRTFASVGWLDRNGDGILDKDGKPFKFDLLVMSGSGVTMGFAQLFQSELKKIGVDAKIVVLEGAAAIQRIIAGNYEAAYLAWDLDPDPDPYALFHSSQFPPRGQNFVFHSDPETDRLIDAARRELDFDKRVKLCHALHQVLADEQPYTWSIQVSLKWGLNKRIKGVTESRGGYGLYLWYPGEFEWWLDPAAR